MFAILFVTVLVTLVVSSTSLRTLAGDLKVSNLGIGTWAWGDKFFWKYNPDLDDELQKTYEYCRKEADINLFDTAEIYGLGRSELLVGRFNRKIPGNNTLLTSKFAPLPWRFTSDSVVNACQASLDRMGIDQMELYQLHWPAGWKNEEYWKGMRICYEKGLIKSVGVSNYGPKLLREAHEYFNRYDIPLATNQIQFSLLCRSAEENGLLKVAEELNVGILAYSPLAQGILTGKYSSNNLPLGPRSALVRANIQKAQPLLSKMSSIAKTKSMEAGAEVSMSQLALSWCIGKGTIPIPGARTMKQAKDNCAAKDLLLTPEEVRSLDIAARGTGINIPTPLQGK